jgi:hypothetical protein
MSNALSIALAPGTPAKQGAARRSDRMLSELLELNKEMIAQLRLERQEVAGTTNFITGLIGDHEKAVARLRAQLKSFESGRGAPNAAPSLYYYVSLGR